MFDPSKLETEPVNNPCEEELHVHDVSFSDELHLSKRLLRCISMYPFRKNQLSCSLTLRPVNTWEPPAVITDPFWSAVGQIRKAAAAPLPSSKISWQAPSTACIIYH